MVGLIGAFSRPDSAVGDLVSMWTDPVSRRTGVGEALAAAVVEWARSAGYESLELWVMGENRAAISLYERCGFESIPEYVGRPDDPCRDELRIRLDLA